MKRIMAVVLAAMLALACTVSAFAQTDSAATPDEVLKGEVASIELTKLPDKLTYTDVDAEFDVDENDVDFLNAELKINIDLTGAVVEATYFDGTVEEAPLSECTATVADPFCMSDIDFENADIEDEDAYLEFLDELMNNIYRTYTVDVEYKGAKTSYNIDLEMSDVDVDPESDYELVSYVAPEKLGYAEYDLTEIYSYDFETDEEIVEMGIEPDVTGMSVILRNKTTGELVTVGEDDIFCDDVIVDDVKGINQTFTVNATAFVTADDGITEDYVDFTFEIEYNSVAYIDDPDNPAPGNDGKDESNAVATNDTASKDSAVKTDADNTAVQTGGVMPAALALAIISGAALAMFGYRRKFVK